MNDRGPQAGWYDDPEYLGSFRYWDGTTWTIHRAPGPPAVRSSSPAGQRSWGSALGHAALAIGCVIIAVLVVLLVAAAVFLPFAADPPPP